MLGFVVIVIFLEVNLMVWGGWGIFYYFFYLGCFGFVVFSSVKYYFDFLVFILRVYILVALVFGSVLKVLGRVRIFWFSVYFFFFCSIFLIVF